VKFMGAHESENLPVRMSHVAQQMIGQPMFQVIDRVRIMEDAGRDVVHLEIGEPDFETPENISIAAVEAIQAGDTHYVSSWGVREFREACARATQRSRGFLPDLEQVLVTPGANIATFLTILTLVNHGEEVLYPDPGFPTYEASVRAAGVEGVRYGLEHENGFRISSALVEEQITDKTRLIIVNSPSNPTGAVSDERELRKVFELARAHNIFIFSDEIYARMTYSHSFFSLGSLDGSKERVIVSNGFSKAFAMTGWRLGVAIGPAAIMERMMLLLQTTLSCVPPFVQRAGIAALDEDQSQVKAMMEEYRRRRDLVVEEVNSIPGLFADAPGGAFYLFPSIKETGLSSSEFAERLLEEEAVAVLPGHNFGPSGEGYIRISFASGEERLREGLIRIRSFCERLTR